MLCIGEKVLFIKAHAKFERNVLSLNIYNWKQNSEAQSILEKIVCQDCACETSDSLFDIEIAPILPFPNKSQ